MTILHADPRRLLVGITARLVSVLAVVLHAPHVGHATVVENWWLETARLLAEHRSHFGCVCILMDANASFPESVDSRVGEHIFDGHKNVAGGDGLGKMVRRLDLWAPGTYDDCLARLGRANNGTYLHDASGSPVIIDYVLCSPDVAARPGTYCTMYDFQAVCDGWDHWPVCVDLCFPVSLQPSIAKRRVLPYDSRKIDDPACVKTFQQLMRGRPIVPFNVDPTSHCHILREFVLQCAVDAFPHGGALPKKPFITEHTFQLIAMAGKLRK
eukprot:3894766-Karenia_brevis.AAC.1